jgi:hypothetical protein
MTIANSNQELFEKLGQFVAIFSLVGVSSSTMTPLFSEPARWEMSSASTIEVESARSTIQAIEMALSEVRSARAILHVREAGEDRAFWSYVTAVDVALKTYEASGKGDRETRGFAASLAFARTALQDQIATLPTWVAVARAARPDLDRYARVPNRFRATRPVELLEQTLPSADDANLWFVLDTAAHT